MLKVLLWIKDYWYIPLFVIVVIAGWIVWSRWGVRGQVPPMQKIVDEVHAIGEARKTREIQLTAGAEEAKKHVNEKYAETKKRLDAEGNLKVKELENDPVALAKYLDRVAGSGH